MRRDVLWRSTLGDHRLTEIIDLRISEWNSHDCYVVQDRACGVHYFSPLHELVLRLRCDHVIIDFLGLTDYSSSRKGLENQELKEYLKYDKWLLHVASTKLTTAGLRNSTGTWEIANFWLVKSSGFEGFGPGWGLLRQFVLQPGLLSAQMRAIFPLQPRGLLTEKNGSGLQNYEARTGSPLVGASGKWTHSCFEYVHELKCPSLRFKVQNKIRKHVDVE